MILHRYHLDCLSHSSYLVGDESAGEAIVVDPRRDITEYLADADAAGLRIVGVVNTHFHADFVAGHLELAAATGAWIGYGQRAEADYDIRRLSDGEHIVLGGVDLEVVETPGHTWESISLLVRVDGEELPSAVLSGDTLFNGDVGRPDLAVSVGADARELARAQYDSVHRLLGLLPDETQLLPAHGAGSACGRGISAELASTIGDQRRTNAAVQPMTVDEFVEQLLEGQTPAPRYFAEDAVLNRRSRELWAGELPPARTTDELRAAIADGVVVLDARSAPAFAQVHVRGSINAGLDGRFAETAGMFISVDEPVLVVTGSDTAREAVTRLARVGIDRVVGIIDEQAFGALADLHATTGRVDVEEFERLRSSGEATIVDVRNPGERALGAVPGSIAIPLAELAARHGELPDGPLVLHCAAGWRSSVASSALRRWGHDDVRDLVGGYAAWRSAAAAQLA